MIQGGMRRFIAACLIVLASPAFAEQARGPLPPSVNVCFTPGEDCTQRIVQAIDGAKRQILVQAYGFSSAPILDALKRAAARNVEVLIILDKSNDRGVYSGATFMTNAGIPVWIDPAPGIAHNKVMVIDGETTVTGSFNFTRAAQTKNAENLLIIVSRPVAQRFRENWDQRLKVSKAYEGLPASQ